MLKQVLLYALTLCFFSGYGNHRQILDGLAAINSYWTQQTDIGILTMPETGCQTDQDWIALHLEHVETTLRNRAVPHLSAAQRENRLHCLDILRQYRLDRNFPINEVFAYRCPIFIDPYDNFCAVGYLVKETGYEPVSRTIAAKTNYAYVREMDYPELVAWAENYGFSVAELAWIQPTYGSPPGRDTRPLGKGTNGEVITLYPDPVLDQLYVGGYFSLVDSAYATGGIAYLTKSGGGYTWHTMGNGVTGTVYAITRHGNDIFVAGNITEADGVSVNNVAYWDGNNWHAAGCLDGTVYDLAVLNGVLYAAGSFENCGALQPVNVARWTGTAWQGLPGLDGYINTLETMNDVLLLGGAFSHAATGAVNVIQWNPAVVAFEAFSNNLPEVKDFEWFEGDMHVVCAFVPGDTTLIKRLNAGTGVWEDRVSYFNFETSFYAGAIPIVNTLCAQGDTLMAGGDFYSQHLISYAPIVQHSVAAIAPVMGSDINWFLVDSAINKMVVFDGDMIVGGKFDRGYNHMAGSQHWLRSIGRKVRALPLSVSTPALSSAIKIVPNPAVAASSIKVAYPAAARHFILRDISGKVLEQQTLAGTERIIQLPAIAAGTYLVEVSNEAGYREITRLLITK